MILRFTLLATIAFLLGFNQKALATHAAGGELIYNLKPGTTNTYIVIFKFYRNCANPSTTGGNNVSASGEPASFTLCYTSPCTGTISSVVMPKMIGDLPTSPPTPNGSVLSNGCNNNNTTCTNLQSTIFGYEQWWYSAEITLPVACNSWKLWTTLCCRNNAVQNVTNPGSQNIYVEANLDNSIINTVSNSNPTLALPSNLNNSARFLNSNSAQSLPIPYVCVNTLFVHNGGAMDPDGDSLSFETIVPRHHPGCSAVNPTDVLIIPTYNILNTGGNPLACNNTYNLNTQTGEFSFTPNQVGPWVISQKINEWRKDANGVAYLVGSVMRDMQIMVDNCIPLPVTPNIDSLSVIGGTSSNDTVKACPNQQLSYCFDIVGGVMTYVISIADNSSTALLGSTITYTNPSNNILRGCVTWTPSLSDTGYHNLLVSVKDTANCLSNPAVVSFPVYVNRPIRAWNDTSICLGQTATLSSFGNGFYDWDVLPGGASSGSINDTSLAVIQATPNTTTFYVAEDLVCGTKDTVQVTILTGPTLTMSPDTTTCVNSTMQLSVTPNPAGNYTYNWVPAAGLNDPTLPNPILIDPTFTTTYTVTVTPQSIVSCPSVGNVTVDVLNGYLIGNNDTIICNGDFVQINAFGGNVKYNYQWSPTTFVNNPNSLNPVTISPTPPGSYPYTFTASYPGCPDSVKHIMIDVQPIPQVNAGSDRQICAGDSVHMNSVVGPVGLMYNYNWSPSLDLNDPTLPNPIFNGQTNTVFTLTVSTSAGCQDSDIMIINVANVNFLKTAGDTSICPHEIAQITAGGGVQYFWSPSLFVTDSNKFTTKAFPLTTTDFQVVGYNAQGCADTAFVRVVVHPEARLDLGDNKMIFPTESVQLFAEGNCSLFAWSPPNGLSATNLSNPIAQPSVTTRYFVTGSTEHGCSVMDSIDVIVKPESLVELPNAFSPGSGTSVNDELRIIVRGNAKLNSFNIFNRWGELVFSTTDINKGWNGQYKGKPQPLGSYIYSIDATSSTGKRVTKQGNVTLLR